MSKNTDFAMCLKGLFNSYLSQDRNASANTLSAYSYTFSLLLQYLKDKQNISPHKFTISQFNADVVQKFLCWLEVERGTVFLQGISALVQFIHSVAIWKWTIRNISPTSRAC